MYRVSCEPDRQGSVARKKLTEAGARWATGAGDPGPFSVPVEDDSAFINLPDEFWEHGATPEGSTDFYVWPENWAAFVLFTELRTQWRFSPMGQPTGLDYAGVQAALAMRGAKRTTGIFRDIQLLECGALDARSKLSGHENQ